MGFTGLSGQCAAVGDGVLRSIDVQAEGRRSGRRQMSWLGIHMQMNRKFGRNFRTRGFTQNPELCGPEEREVLGL